MSFSVVTFPEDDSVEVISSSWINEGVCLYPPYRGGRFLAAVKKHEQPTATWAKYDCRVLHSYGNCSVILICLHVMPSKK